MPLQPPVTAAAFKAQFDRDFPFGTGLDTVRDADINKAFTSALMVFNPALWEDTTSGGLAFMYAAAHFLWVSIKVAGGLIPVQGRGKGLKNSSEGVTVSKTVGAVSAAYERPPEFVQKHMALLPFWESEYGKQYCMMLGPRLIGNVVAVYGEIDPQTYPDPGNTHI